MKLPIFDLITLDIKTLYNMAKAATRGAERACEALSDKGGAVFGAHTGYPVYIGEYNRLLPLVIEQFGKEAEELFQPIDLGKEVSPASALPIMWRTYSELAAARLNALTAYLQGKVGAIDIQIQAIIDLIRANLRPAIFEDPKEERDIHNTLEIIFRARAIEFKREKVAIQYSSKNYFPDFTFDFLDLAIEVKLCNSEEKEKKIIDEINADIPAYQTKYNNVIFIVYDLGFIRDVELFKSGIESNPGIHVLIVKK